MSPGATTLARMPAPRAFERDVAAQSRERGLRRVVRGDARARLQARDRRDEHDRAAVVHHRQRGAARRGSGRARSPRARGPSRRPTFLRARARARCRRCTRHRRARRARAPPRRRSARTSSSSRDVADDRPRRAAPSASTSRAVSAAASAIDVGARDRRALARREHRDRAPVADRRVGIVGRARPRADDEDSGDPSRARSATSARAECTFSRHVLPRGSRAHVRRHGPPDRVVLGRDRRPPGPAALADPAPAVGVGRDRRSSAGSRPGRRRRSGRTSQHSPFVSCSYWTDNHDTCIAECRAEWHFDDETRTTVWDKFVQRARARRLRPRDRPRLGQADVGHVRRAAPRAVAPARLPRHRAPERRHRRRHPRLAGLNA